MFLLNWSAVFLIIAHFQKVFFSPLECVTLFVVFKHKAVNIFIKYYLYRPAHDVFHATNSEINFCSGYELTFKNVCYIKNCGYEKGQHFRL